MGTVEGTSVREEICASVRHFAFARVRSTPFEGYMRANKWAAAPFFSRGDSAKNDSRSCVEWCACAQRTVYVRVDSVRIVYPTDDLCGYDGQCARALHPRCVFVKGKFHGREGS